MLVTKTIADVLPKEPVDRFELILWRVKQDSHSGGMPTRVRLVYYVEAEFKEVFPDQDYGKPFRNQWLWHEQYYGCAERSVGRSGCWDAPLEMSDFFVSEADALRAVEAWEQDRRDHLMKQIDRSFELTVLATHRLRQLQ